ncbi:hypothetical protein GCM10020256_03620 [Streptomyces thermocoprophilus]
MRSWPSPEAPREAAYDELVSRAKSGGRTLLEECWLTLGSLPPPSRPSAVPRTQPSRPPAAATGDSARRDMPGAQEADALARLGRALVLVRSRQDLAAALLEHLRHDVGAEAVMIFSRLPVDGIELIGYAGVDETLAAQWRHVPPLRGVAPYDALVTGEAAWLEDFTAAEKRFRLIGNPPQRWRSRAWLPAGSGERPDIVIGVLRTRPEPFAPRAREHIWAAVGLCAGRLHSLDSPAGEGSDDAAGLVQAVFDALPGAALLLTPVRSAGGAVQDFRIDAASPQAVDAAGRTGRELAGLRLREYRPTVTDEPLWQGCLNTLATGKPYESEPFAQRQTVGGAAELATYVVRVVRFGEGLMTTWIRHDPSDRQEQRLADVQRLGNLGWATWNLLTHEAAWSAQAYAVLGQAPADGPVRLAELPGLAVPEDAPALSGAVGGCCARGGRSTCRSGSAPGTGPGICGPSRKRSPTAAGRRSRCTGSYRTSPRSAAPSSPSSRASGRSCPSRPSSRRSGPSRPGSSRRCCRCRRTRCCWRGCGSRSPICRRSPV